MSISNSAIDGGYCQQVVLNNVWCKLG
jgi:hypothetical protein